MMYLQFTLYENPLENSLTLFLNGILQPIENYAIGQRDNETILEWAHPTTPLDFTDELMARYLTKNGYCEQSLLPGGIKQQKISFLSTIKRSITNLFKRGE